MTALLPLMLLTASSIRKYTCCDSRSQSTQKIPQFRPGARTCAAVLHCEIPGVGWNILELLETLLLSHSLGVGRHLLMQLTSSFHLAHLMWRCSSRRSSSFSSSVRLALLFKELILLFKCQVGAAVQGAHPSLQVSGWHRSSRSSSFSSSVSLSPLFKELILLFKCQVGTAVQGAHPSLQVSGWHRCSRSSSFSSSVRLAPLFKELILLSSVRLAPLFKELILLFKCQVGTAVQGAHPSLQVSGWHRCSRRSSSFSSSVRLALRMVAFLDRSGHDNEGAQLTP